MPVYCNHWRFPPWEMQRESRCHRPKLWRRCHGLRLVNEIVEICKDSKDLVESGICSYAYLLRKDV